MHSNLLLIERISLRSWHQAIYVFTKYYQEHRQKESVVVYHWETNMKEMLWVE